MPKQFNQYKYSFLNKVDLKGVIADQEARMKKNLTPAQLEKHKQAKALEALIKKARQSYGITQYNELSRALYAALLSWEHDKIAALVETHSDQEAAIKSKISELDKEIEVLERKLAKHSKEKLPSLHSEYKKLDTPASKLRFRDKFSAVNESILNEMIEFDQIIQQLKEYNLEKYASDIIHYESLSDKFFVKASWVKLRKSQKTSMRASMEKEDARIKAFEKQLTEDVEKGKLPQTTLDAFELLTSISERLLFISSQILLDPTELDPSVLAARLKSENQKIKGTCAEIDAILEKYPNAEPLPSDLKKQLRFKYHPDKHTDQATVYTMIFQHLQNAIALKEKSYE